MVLDINHGPEAPSFYAEIKKWRASGGPSHLLHHLMHELNTTNFDASESAPVTAAKEAMIELSKANADLVIEDMLRNPDRLLKTISAKGRCELVTVQEIACFADPDRKISIVALGKALSRFRVPQKSINTREGTQRLRAIKRPEYWEKESDAAWTNNYNNFRASNPKYAPR